MSNPLAFPEVSKADSILFAGKMVVRSAWLPSRGTISIGETHEPTNPTIGAIFHSELSPAGQNATESQSQQPTATSAKELLSGPHFDTFLNVASLCNLAKLENKGEEGWVARGDPTECAIQVFAHRFEWGRESLTDGDRPQWGKHHHNLLCGARPYSLLLAAQIAEFPFDSDAKRMSVIFAKSGTE